MPKMSRTDPSGSQKSGQTVIDMKDWTEAPKVPPKVPSKVQYAGQKSREISTVEEAAKEVVKHKRPGRSELNVPHPEPGENTRYMRHSLTMMEWKKPDMKDPAAVKDRVMQYFELCGQNDMKPSIEGLGVAFGTNRKVLWKWVNGLVQSVPPESREVLQIAYDTINAQMADYMQNGKINPVAGIFLMKNNMGYEDKTEMVLTPNTPLGEEQRPEVIAERYAELPE